MLDKLFSIALGFIAFGFIIWLADTATNVAGSMAYATAYNNVGRLAE